MMPPGFKSLQERAMDAPAIDPWMGARDLKQGSILAGFILYLSRTAVLRGRFQSLRNSLLAFHAAQILRQDFLPQADRLRRHLDPLILINPLDALLEGHLPDPG